jgi:predicted MFS family arabinose efflux permease
MAVKLPRALSSLEVPNYRRFFTGQVVSATGMWVQSIAVSWLVYNLTGSGVALGIVNALQFLPILVGGAWGGLLADRLDKRRLLIVTQSLMVIPGFALWIVTATGVVQVWMVYVLVFVRGTLNAVDNPARQSFVVEIVGRDRLLNAVSLNSAIVQSSRMIGAALAAVVIATAGISTCFLLNALSFSVTIAALVRMRPADLHPAPAAERAPGQLRAALQTVLHSPALRTPLLLMLIVSPLTLNFVVILPIVARHTYGGNATTFALMTVAMGIGAVFGALRNGMRSSVSLRIVSVAALVLGGSLALTAFAPVYAVALALLVVVGAASVTFTATINSLLQLSAKADMRGRVMALFTVVFLGSVPLGAPLIGWLGGSFGTRTALVFSAVSATAAGILGIWSGRREARSVEAVEAATG